jgi:hypothetical protein
MFELQQNVPMPPTIRPNARGRRRKYPFEQMTVGSMFFVPNKTRQQINGHIYTVSKQLGIKLRARLAYMRREKDQWVPCDQLDEGAVLGVGVWRDE